MHEIPRSEGRRLFGSDPARYASARPGYPDALYACLSNRCGLRPGTSVFEVGPGPGLATTRLLMLGASPLRAIEPDPRLAAYLRETIPADAMVVDQAPFEDAKLPAAAFDLGVAATSFHWLDQRSALAKVYEALRPGGWWAMWWTHVGPIEPDAFYSAIDHLFAETPASPFMASKQGPPFGLDREGRLQDLLAAGFKDAKAAIWRWSMTYDAARLVDLYGTFSPILALEPDRRRQVLRELARIVDEQFGGQIERPLVTALYTAQRP